MSTATTATVGIYNTNPTNANSNITNNMNSLNKDLLLINKANINNANKKFTKTFDLSQIAEDPMDTYLDTLGLWKKRIARDGSCLFRAVAEQIYPCQFYHEKVRHECIEYMSAHRDEYAKFVSGIPFDDYLDAMRNPLEYGGQLEIAAMSKLYKHDFIIYQHPEQPGIDVTQNDFKKKIYLSYSYNNHFDAIFTKTFRDNLALIQSLVYEHLYTSVFGAGEQVAVARRLLRKSDTIYPKEFMMKYKNNDFDSELDEFDEDDGENLEDIGEHELTAGAEQDEEEEKSAETDDDEAEDRLDEQQTTSTTGDLNNKNEKSFDKKTKNTSKSADGSTTLLKMPLPYKVAKSLDPVIYRNTAFDAWLATKKENEEIANQKAISILQHGDKCLVKLPTYNVNSSTDVNNNSSNLHQQHKWMFAFVHNILHNSANVYVPELNEHHCVPLENLKVYHDMSTSSPHGHFMHHPHAHMHHGHHQFNAANQFFSGQHSYAGQTGLNHYNMSQHSTQNVQKLVQPVNSQFSKIFVNIDNKRRNLKKKQQMNMKKSQSFHAFSNELPTLLEVEEHNEDMFLYGAAHHAHHAHHHPSIYHNNHLASYHMSQAASHHQSATAAQAPPSQPPTSHHGHHAHHQFVSGSLHAPPHQPFTHSTMTHSQSHQSFTDHLHSNQANLTSQSSSSNNNNINNNSNVNSTSSTYASKINNSNSTGQLNKSSSNNNFSNINNASNSFMANNNSKNRSGRGTKTSQNGANNTQLNSSSNNTKNSWNSINQQQQQLIGSANMNGNFITPPAQAAYHQLSGSLAAQGASAAQQTQLSASNAFTNMNLGPQMGPMMGQGFIPPQPPSGQTPLGMQGPPPPPIGPFMHQMPPMGMGPPPPPLAGPPHPSAGPRPGYFNPINSQFMPFAMPPPPPLGHPALAPPPPPPAHISDHTTYYFPAPSSNNNNGNSLSSNSSTINTVSGSSSANSSSNTKNNVDRAGKRSSENLDTYLNKDVSNFNSTNQQVPQHSAEHQAPSQQQHQNTSNYLLMPAPTLNNQNTSTTSGSMISTNGTSSSSGLTRSHSYHSGITNNLYETTAYLDVYGTPQGQAIGGPHQQHLMTNSTNSNTMNYQNSLGSTTFDNSTSSANTGFNYNDIQQYPTHANGLIDDSSLLNTTSANAWNKSNSNKLTKSSSLFNDIQMYANESQINHMHGAHLNHNNPHQHQQQAHQQSHHLQQQSIGASGTAPFGYSNCFVVNIDGPINFNATHSLQDDGSDLPLNDINTIRFFYNLGIEYYRLNLAPPHAAHMPVSIAAAPLSSAIGPTAYLSNSYYAPMSNSNNQTGPTSHTTNLNSEQQLTDKTGLNLTNSSSSINQQVVPNSSSQTQSGTTNSATSTSMSTNTASSASSQKPTYSRRVH